MQTCIHLAPSYQSCSIAQTITNSAKTTARKSNKFLIFMIIYMYRFVFV